MSHVEPSVEANDAPAPTAIGMVLRGGRPRRARRTVLSRVAPAITGSATWRESLLASSRVNRRRRAAASVAPLREIPGSSAHACAMPSHSASVARASREVRVWGARSARAIATDPATSPTAIVAGVPRWRSIGRSSAKPTIAGGRNDRTMSSATRRLMPCTASDTSVRSVIRSAAAVPACSATSKALRSSGSTSQ